MSETLSELGIKDLDLSTNPTQRDFLACTARYQLYSGGFGSGKTSVCCLKAQIISRTPNNMGVICRQSYPDLRDTTRKTFLEILRPDWVRNWKESENALTLKNGSVILFRHFEEGKIKVGANIGWFFIDQAEESDENIFKGLMGRMRRQTPLPGGGYARRYGMLAMNPNGEDWQWRLFVQNKSPDFAHFDSTTMDNEANLPPGFIQDLLNNYSVDWLDRFVYGKWSKMSGLIYQEFDDNINMVDPFDIPKDWIKGRGNDWGVDAPATCAFIAQSPDGKYYVFDEYMDAEKTPEEHSDAILAQSKPYGVFRASIMDSNAWHRESDLKSVADKYRARGYVCLPASKDQMAGILLIKHLLKTGRLLFFRGRTERTIEEIKKWKWASRQTGKEIPARGNDHLLDALRYILFWFDKKKFQEIHEAPSTVTRRYEAKLSRITEFDEADPVTGLPA